MLTKTFSFYNSGCFTQHRCLWDVVDRGARKYRKPVVYRFESLAIRYTGTTSKAAIYRCQIRKPKVVISLEKSAVILRKAHRWCVCRAQNTTGNDGREQWRVFCGSKFKGKGYVNAMWMMKHYLKGTICVRLFFTLGLWSNLFVSYVACLNLAHETMQWQRGGNVGGGSWGRRKDWSKCAGYNKLISTPTRRWKETPAPTASISTGTFVCLICTSSMCLQHSKEARHSLNVTCLGNGDISLKNIDTIEKYRDNIDTAICTGMHH